MRNKVWLLALALLVVHSGRAWGDENHSRSTAITQQAKTKVVKGVVLDDMGPVIGATVFVGPRMVWQLIWMENFH